VERTIAASAGHVARGERHGTEEELTTPHVALALHDRAQLAALLALATGTQDLSKDLSEDFRRTF